MVARRAAQSNRPHSDTDEEEAEDELDEFVERTLEQADQADKSDKVVSSEGWSSWAQQALNGGAKPALRWAKGPFHRSPLQPGLTGRTLLPPQDLLGAELQRCQDLWWCDAAPPLKESLMLPPFLTCRCHD